MHTDNKIIDIALKYGYDSPDSFTKAFTRFHGSTPTEVRKGKKIKEFAHLKVFSCIGPASVKMREKNKRIFKE